MAELLALLYVLLVPFFYYFLPRLPVVESNPVRLVAAALGALAVLSPPRFRVSFAAHGRQVLYVLGFMYGLRLLASMSNHSAEAVLRDTFTVMGLFLALGALSAPKSLMRPHTTLRAVALAGSFSGLLAVGVWSHTLPVPPWSEREEIFSLERTGWCVDGMIGVLGQMACFALAIAPRRGRDRALGLGGYGLCWLNILLGQFRTYVAFGLLTSAGLVCWALWSNWRRLAFGIAAVALLAALVVADPLGRVSVVAERFALGEGLGTDIVRRSEQELELELIREKPLFGHGFGLQYYESHWPVSGMPMPAYGHNLFTSLGARAGLPLLGMLTGGWIALGVRCALRVWRRAKSSDRLINYCGAMIVFGVLAFGPALNLLTMTWSAPAYALFLAPSLRSVKGRGGSVRRYSANDCRP